MNSNYFITNARVVNQGKTEWRQVLVLNGMIDHVFRQERLSLHYLQDNNIQKIDAKGMYLIPGVIDDQVHFREPGLTHKGDIQSESKAAVAGGVTSFLEMPNTIPQTTTIELLEEKYQLAAEKSYANYGFYLGATNDNIEELKKFNPKKYPGIKLFLGASTGNMLVNKQEVLEKIFALRFLIAIHSEDEEIIQKNIATYRAQYGEDVPMSCHPLIRSEEACVVSTQRAVDLAKKLRTRLHVLHLSTAAEAKMLFQDIPLHKKKITSEVCVQHLLFSDKDYETLGSKIKWNPAIKTEEDRKILMEYVHALDIDMIASDHAPHTWDEKSQSYFKCPSGGPMVQHTLIAMFNREAERKLPLPDLVQLMCHNPAICFNIKKRGFIKAGYHADLVLIDPEGETTVTKESILSKCGWSPLEGRTFKGRIEKTFVNGEIVFNGKQVNDKRFAQRLTFNA